jgi:hypothetical protein
MDRAYRQSWPPHIEQVIAALVPRVDADALVAAAGSSNAFDPWHRGKAERRLSAARWAGLRHGRQRPGLYQAMFDEIVLSRSPRA